MFSKKIKLFFLTIFPFLSINLYAGRTVDSSGNIVYTFLVDNPSMVDAYFNIFNAMASFFQSNDYLELLKVVFLLGGLSVFFIGVMKVYQGGDAKGSLGDFVKYMILGTALLTLIFSHKSQMVIKTNNLPSFCPTGPTSSTSLISSAPTTTGVVVGNIPEVLAWTFSLINEVGRETTRLATMGFTAVDANLMTYTTRSDYASYLQGVGTVLSSQLKDFNSKFNNTYNISLQQGLEAIFRDCIAAPASNSGDEGFSVMTAFTNTGNLRQTLTDYIMTANVNVYKNPTDTATVNTLVTAYKSGGKFPGDFLTTINGSTYSCSQVYAVVENIFIQLEASNDLVCSKNLKDYWNPETMAIFTGDNTINTVTQAKTIALQAALANEIMDSKNNIAPAELSFATGKSTAEFVTNSLGTGYYMAQMLPYLQMGMRAVMYAFFPLVFIVVLLPGGIKVLMSYLQTLIWIELWSPTAAVLNMFLSIMATDKFANMYNSEGFNATQGLMTFSDSAMLASVAGYLYASVPALTWLILKGSGQMLGNITGAMGARIASNLQSDSIIKDKMQLGAQHKVNEERKEKGQQMISLAEMDALNAQHEAWASAGNFQAKQETMDKAFNSGYGKQMLDVTKSAAVGELFNGPNGQKYKNSTEVSTKGEMEKTAVEQTVTGQLTKDGKIDDNRAHKVNVGLGTVSGIDSNSRVHEHQFNEKRDPKNPNYEEKLSEAKGINLSAKDNGEVKEQYERAVLHDKDPNNAMQQLKEADIKEMTNIAKTLQDESTTQSYFMQKGVFNKDANGDVERNGESFNNKDLQKVIYATGKFNAGMQDVQDKVNQGKITNHGKQELVKNELTTLAKTVGANKESQEIYKRSLNQVIQNGGADSDQAKKALASFEKGNFYQGLVESAGVSSLQGVMGEMRNKVESDQTAVKLQNANVNTNNTSDMKVNETTTGIDTGAIKYKELSGSDKGIEELDKAKDQIINEDKNGQALTHLNDKEQVFENGKAVTNDKGEAVFKPTQEAEKAQRLVAERAMSNIKAKNESFTNMETSSKVNKLIQDGYTAQDIGKGDAVKTEIDNIKNIAYGGIGVKTKAVMDLTKEGVSVSKAGKEIINKLLDSPDIPKDVKERFKEVKETWSRDNNKTVNTKSPSKRKP